MVNGWPVLFQVNDPSWFDGVASCDDAVKAKLSPHAQKMIDNMKQDEADKEKKVLAYFVCLFVSIAFFSSFDPYKIVCVC